jgi:hypothetical protein
LNAQESPPGGRRPARAGRSSCIIQRLTEKPVVYIVPIASILGRLPLIPAGTHDTVAAALRGRKRELFPLKNATRTGSRAQAEGSTISARGPCAGPPTTPRSQAESSVHQVCKVCTLICKVSVHLAQLVLSFNQVVETNACFAQTLQTLCAYFEHSPSVLTKCILRFPNKIQTKCTLQ